MSNFDNLVKSRSNDWIPAFAGMTVLYLFDMNCFIVILAKAGIQKNGGIRLFTRPSIFDVRCSTFKAYSPPWRIRCSGQAEFHTSTAAGRQRPV
jgi:hypothetical protein